MDHENHIAALHERKAWLEKSLDQIEETLDTTPSADFEERATEREGDEVLESLGTAELLELKQINAALDRVAAGEYGICVKCGEDISDERLKIVPHTPMCRNCA